MDAALTPTVPAGRDRSLRDTRPEGATVVVVPRGSADGVLPEIVGADAEWLAIDLSQVDDPHDWITTLVTALAQSRRPQGRTCAVVPGRPSVRGIATFASIGDAYQAKLLADAGFGTGWSDDGSGPEAFGIEPRGHDQPTDLTERPIVPSV